MAAPELRRAASGGSRPQSRNRDQQRLRITEIFRSLQGEGRDSGWPTVFVRLTGCPLRCQYCDTAYAFHGGQLTPLAAVLDTVAGYDTRHVCVTGGEPLAQAACRALLQALCERGHTVSLETSGALDIRGIDPRVSRVVDIKTPDSGEADKNRWDNLADLRAQDQVKFVICSRQDYLWAREVLERYELAAVCDCLFSPSAEQMDPAQLAQWLLDDGLPVRFQMQLHKLLWGDARGR